MLTILDLMGVIAFVISIAIILANRIRHHVDKKQMISEFDELVREMDSILDDLNLYDNDLLYDVDVSLRDYFRRHGSDIVRLSDRLRSSRTAFYLTDKPHRLRGEFLVWLSTRFYEQNQEDEDERIRVWVNGISEYRELKRGWQTSARTRQRVQPQSQ